MKWPLNTTSVTTYRPNGLHFHDLKLYSFHHVPCMQMTSATGQETSLQGVTDSLTEIGRCNGMEMNVSKIEVMITTRQ